MRVCPVTGSRNLSVARPSQKRSLKYTALIIVGVLRPVTWSPAPVRNYRDYKRTDFATAELSWLWGVNRGILTPPGLDEQWLVSLAHTAGDMELLVAEFTELAQALRA